MRNSLYGQKLEINTFVQMLTTTQRALLGLLSCVLRHFGFGTDFTVSFSPVVVYSTIPENYVLHFFFTSLFVDCHIK
jgi:hypothetical protein